jgi:hypothetical protein
MTSATLDITVYDFSSGSKTSVKLCTKVTAVWDPEVGHDIVHAWASVVWCHVEPDS